MTDPGKNYERRTIKKYLYGFRRYASKGIFDSGFIRFDENGNMQFVMAQQKYSGVRKPYASRWDHRRIMSWIYINNAWDHIHPWLWVGFITKQKGQKETWTKLNVFLPDDNNKK